MNENIKNNIWEKVVKELLEKVKNQDDDSVSKNQLIDVHGILKKKKVNAGN